MPQLYDIFKALSDETRYNLVKLLLCHDLCVGALASRLNISKPAVSQHLKILRESGLVRGDKRGYFTHYYVDRDILKNVSTSIVELSDLCKDADHCSYSAKSFTHNDRGEVKI